MKRKPSKRKIGEGCTVEIREVFVTRSGQHVGENTCRWGLKPSRTVKDLDEFRRVAGHLLGGPINRGPARDR